VCVAKQVDNALSAVTLAPLTSRKGAALWSTARQLRRPHDHPDAATTEQVASLPRRVTAVATLVGVRVDVATTRQVSGQVRDAAQRVFSYDLARLDDNERTATDVITGPFARDYHQ
jgi:hypothetical protein